MQRFWLSVLSVVLIGSCLFALSTAAMADEVAIGERIANLEFKDIWYLPRSLDALGEPKAYTIVFTTLSCPQAKAYLPELKRLDEAYCDRGVQMLAINVGPDDSIRHIAAQALEHEIKFPFVKDMSGDCARAVGATETPTVVVLDAQRRLRYRGRIDDRFVGSRPRAAKKRDLVAALDAVLAGDEVKVAETAVRGVAMPPYEVIEADESITFADHVAPLMEQHCQRCHREGTEAPFALVTYQDAADHAEMIAEVVRDERMPPWYASHGSFSNDPTMQPEEKRTIAAWVAAGCPPGDLSKLPEPAVELTEPLDWTIDEPDLVIQVPEVHELPADGYVPYKYVILPYRFEHDTWIQQCEILPDNPRVVHHCNMAYLANAFDWSNAEFVIGRVPGVQPMQLTDNVAYLIPKGALLILQIHYTTTGQPEKCRISVGMRYAREVVHKKFHFLWMVDTKFAIPPGDPLHRVVATNELKTNALGVGLFSHMHLRGRAMSFAAHYPDGTIEKLLKIPNYSFDWQMAYRWDLEAKHFPKGTRIECIAHYDNSTFNPYNPDPTDTVTEGQQTFQEMLNGVMFYLDADEHLNLHIDPKTGRVIEQQARADEK